METLTTKASATFPIMEHFVTLQGEGFHAGKAAYFVRTGGCDVGCHWCDVKESWPGDGHVRMSVEQIQNQVEQHSMEIVVVTGGEPAMHDLAPLTKAFKATGLQTHIETSGVYPLTGDWDWITFSPKKFKPPHEGIYKKAHELKVIVFHPSDLMFAEQHAAKVGEACKLYLQPEWSKRESMMPLIVDYIKSHPRWRISLQTHKYLNIPGKKPFFSSPLFSYTPSHLANGAELLTNGRVNSMKKAVNTKNLVA